MRYALVSLALTFLAACNDETISGYAGTDVTWRLEKLDGKPFPASATLTFPEEGRVAGMAPCNRYFAAQTVPYPWFKTGPIGSTKRACRNLPAEFVYLKALAEMTLSEVANNTLILSNDAGRQMVFRAQ